MSTVGTSRAREVARAALRRRTVRDVLVVSGRAAAWGAGAGLALLAAERVLGLAELAGLGPTGVWGGTGIVIGLGLIAGGVAAGVTLARRRSVVDEAVRLDRALGLEDRLASAVAFTESDAGADRGDAAFVRAAIAEGERAANDADVRSAVPVRVGQGWPTAAAVAAAGVAAALWLPEVGLISAPKRAERLAAIEQVKAEQQRTEAASASIEELRHELESAKEDEPAIAPATDEELEALRDVEQRLEAGAIDAATAQREAARVASEAAEARAAQAEVDRLAGDALRERLAAAAGRADGAGEAGGPELSSTERGLADAVSRGEFDRAAEFAEELLDRAEREDRASRERLAEQLREMAESLRAASDDSASARGDDEASASETSGGETPDAGMPGEPSNSGVDEPLRERLAQEGLDAEAAERVLGAQSEEERRRALEEAGLSESRAAQVADEVEQAERRAEAERRADESAERLSEALDAAAEDLASDEPQASGSDRGTNERSGDEGERPESAAGGQSRPGERGASGGETRDSSAPGHEQRPAEGANTEGASANSNSQGTERTDRPGAQPGERPGEQGSPEGEQRPGGGSSAKPGATPEPTSGQGETPGEEGSEHAAGRDHGAKGEKEGSGGQAPGGTGETKQEQTSPGGAEGQQQGTETGASEGQPGRESEAAGRSGEQGKPDGAGTPNGEGKPGMGREGEGTASAPTGRSGGGQDKQGERGDGGDSLRRPGGGEGDDRDAIPPSDERGLKRLADELRRLEKQERSAGENERRSRELEERAREFMENASPEDRERLREWAEQLAKERDAGPRTSPGGSPDGAGDQGKSPTETAGGFETEVVDARANEPGGDPADQRVVAEWLGEGTASPEAQRREGAKVLREAQRSAERAVEDRVVPARYDRFLREYYRRLPRSVLGEDSQRQSGGDGPKKDDGG